MVTMETLESKHRFPSPLRKFRKGNSFKAEKSNLARCSLFYLGTPFLKKRTRKKLFRVTESQRACSECRILSAPSGLCVCDTGGVLYFVMAYTWPCSQSPACKPLLYVPQHRSALSQLHLQSLLEEWTFSSC